MKKNTTWKFMSQQTEDKKVLDWISYSNGVKRPHDGKNMWRQIGDN